MSLTLKRLESNALRELSICLQRETRSEILHKVTVTEVRITRDLSYATVYYTCLNDDEKEKTAAELEESKGFLRKSLAQKLTCRKMPELIFKYDEALAYGNHINEVLSKLNIPHDDDENSNE